MSQSRPQTFKALKLFKSFKTLKTFSFCVLGPINQLTQLTNYWALENVPGANIREFLG